MQTTIRQLGHEDLSRFSAMDTGIENDYVVHIFPQVIKDDHCLYGLFINNQLASIGGYTVYADTYAMLGRLRSDQRFRGKNLATELMSHIIQEASQDKRISWIGANTQENNLPARRVLEKLGFSPVTTLHAATTQNMSIFETGAQPWTKINNLARKKCWLNQAFIQPHQMFPYECYYPFPATKQLFKERDIQQWHFYENGAKTRVLITKPDQKNDDYLHVVYPWNDLIEQKGLWETIANDYHNLMQYHAKEGHGETYLWMDLTKEAVGNLPPNHKFKLPSPWMLYHLKGMDGKHDLMI